MSKELARIKNLVSEEVWSLLKETNAMIAGGALTSTYTNKDVNDIDVYFRNENDFVSFIKSAFTRESSNPSLIVSDDIGSFTLICTNCTNKSILFIDKYTKQKVQVIAYKLFPTLYDVFQDFDFTINMAGINCKDETMEFHNEFMQHNAQRYLSFNDGTAYPLLSALRVQKYTERGYKISKAQFMKILFRISSLNFTTWDEAKDHCGGMYGMQLENIFPEDKPFSIELMIESLSNIDSTNPDVFNDVFTSSMCEEDIKKSFPKIYENVVDNRVEIDKSRFFKNVKKIGEGQYQSYWDSNFKYNLGGIVNGGVRGIYGYHGSDVATGQSSGARDSVIIELVPIQDAKIVSDSSGVEYTNLPQVYRLIGDAVVVKEYSRTEFMNKYKCD